jgi:hypothetical protein
MDKATARVLQGFLSLSLTQRAELVTEMNRWINGSEHERSLVAFGARESILKVDLGPTSSTCGCCGR